MRSFFRLLVLLLLLAAAIDVFFFHLPYGPSTPTLVEIPAGSGATGMAARLERAGIIRSRFAFLAHRRFTGGTLQAGVYRFDRKATLDQVYDRIARGDVFTLTLVVPEGFNLFDIAGAVQSAGLGSATSFLAAAHANTALIADLSPHATSLEGYLFPDTYRFSPFTTEREILAAMVRRFRQVATQLYLLPPGATVPPTLPDTITLASLIEKEVHLDSERPVVASVFRNRLDLNMPLATDPAVIYAALLANRWHGSIHQSDLAFDSPYNTYRNPGLPPGPIANPGVAALKAAMYPAHTKFLYFVADAHGNTRFSIDLKEHALQVQSYRDSLNNHPQ